ncbi:tRNA (adenosine(37)-N6)-dimethylallyltransferase MiaA [Hydrogenobacter sp. T-2]|uniref:tRNA (adenosine(37)-N6)-dimethylallyltransferase MiaA n=1 Tax=Pampinifervens diazotrophicum TaxID=1632018 RepID=UPI002B25C632|nr:tRNA (adenosine(37)-N6)-dimethylallyltransferase MiaA [Hydrogenobacter sp. T-2]WPM32455.1 tRNA (adenosine(37)-N6)-dimethylallyltransferase MiaA [Hydrogenobacter sp. T-2]
MLIVIGGATGSGKSEVCCLLAKRIGGEIISADSMCVYKHMDVGTAKPLECMKEVKHYLLDIIEPGGLFDAKLFEEYALRAIREIINGGKVPIVCGGTYLYIQALLYGIEETPPPDWKLRERLYEIAKEKGSEYLYIRLRAVDPQYAQKISPRDTRRIVRAIEVFINTGRPFSSFHRWSKPRFDFIGFYIRWSWESLSKRLEERAKRMLEMGLIDEIKKLMQMGFENFLTSPQAIGYKEFIPCIKGQKLLEECLSEMLKNTREYAKRQIRWFRKQGWHEVDMERLGTYSALEEVIKIIELYRQ